jgi:bifunctional DNA-binding transcriptional regulator/antitoxin component of YhaV-PrlF toxin-antitoxin module
MPVLEIEYKGGDIVIPKDTAEKELGLHPGDMLTVSSRRKIKLVPLKKSPEEIARIKQMLEDFRDTFEPADFMDWELERSEIWKSWKLQN